MDKEQTETKQEFSYKVTKTSTLYILRIIQVKHCGQVYIKKNPQDQQMQIVLFHENKYSHNELSIYSRELMFNTSAHIHKHTRPFILEIKK